MGGPARVDMAGVAAVLGPVVTFPPAPPGDDGKATTGPGRSGGTTTGAEPVPDVLRVSGSAPVGPVPSGQEVRVNTATVRAGTVKVPAVRA